MSLYVAWELGDEELFADRLEDIAVFTRARMNGAILVHCTCIVPRTQVDIIILDNNDLLVQQDALGNFSRPLDIPLCSNK